MTWVDFPLRSSSLWARFSRSCAHGLQPYIWGCSTTGSRPAKNGLGKQRWSQMLGSMWPTNLHIYVYIYISFIPTWTWRKWVMKFLGLNSYLEFLPDKQRLSYLTTWLDDSRWFLLGDAGERRFWRHQEGIPAVPGQNKKTSWRNIPKKLSC